MQPRGRPSVFVAQAAQAPRWRARRTAPGALPDGAPRASWAIPEGIGHGLRLVHEVKEEMAEEGMVFPGNTVGRDPSAELATRQPVIARLAREHAREMRGRAGDLERLAEELEGDSDREPRGLGCGH